MSKNSYFAPTGGLPAQTALQTGRAIFTEAYAVLPKDTMRDIVTSFLPHWDKTRCWIIARPLSGFAETFSHYIMEISASGGSDRPEPEADAQGVVFVVEGTLTLGIEGATHTLEPGGYAYIPAGTSWTAQNGATQPVRFHWIRKAYEAVEGIDLPEAFVTSDREVDPIAMPDTEGRWATTRFVEPNDLRHDMHVNVVTFEPGGLIPFEETHVMEHGLYVLEGKAVYKLNRDWV